MFVPRPNQSPDPLSRQRCSVPRRIPLASCCSTLRCGVWSGPTSPTDQDGGQLQGSIRCTGLRFLGIWCHCLSTRSPTTLSGTSFFSRRTGIIRTRHRLRGSRDKPAVPRLRGGLGTASGRDMMAGLLRIRTRRDGSGIVPFLLDASVDSAPWQVARRANLASQARAALVGGDRV